MHIIEFSDAQIDAAVNALLRHSQGKLFIPVDIRQLLIKIAKPRLPNSILEEEKKVHLW